MVPIGTGLPRKCIKAFWNGSVLESYKLVALHLRNPSGIEKTFFVAFGNEPKAIFLYYKPMQNLPRKEERANANRGKGRKD